MSTESNVVPFAPAQKYVFGPYEIIDTLGRGGMGVVYRAHDRTLKREVALKILRDDLRGEERVLARFRREAETFAKLDHPNIVHIYSVGVIEQIPFISMEYIEGETLASRLRREGRMPWQEALRIGAEVAHALQCAHMAQVVHRDVKPGNILLAPDGGVKVTDFGIAKVLNAETQLTIDGSRLGTPQYMCPERCKNKSVTPVSDIYSLGVVLFQAITGKLPYGARSSVELVECITSQAPMRGSSLVQDLPEPVDRLLAWMLEKKPTERPVSAGLLADAIARVLSGKPLDEDAEEREQALADFRRVPAEKREHQTARLPKKAAGKSLAQRWHSLKPRTRVTMGVLAAALLVAPVVLIAAQVAMAPRPMVERISAGEAIARWAPAPALISFAEERPGIRVGSISADGFTGMRLHPGGASGRIVVELTGGAHAAAFTFDAATGESTSIIAPTEGQGTVLGVAPIVADEMGERLLIAAKENTLLSGASNSGALYTSSARSVSAPYLGPKGWEVAVAISRGGQHAWRLEGYGPQSDATDAPITAPGAPIIAAAATPDGGRFAFLREASGKAELWTAVRGGEAVLVDEGALGLSQRAWDAAGAGMVYTLEDAQPRVVHQRMGAEEASATWPGRGAQYMPGADWVIYCAADALLREQLYAVNPAHPLNPVQLTHVETGVAAQFAIDPQGRYVSVALKSPSTQLLVVDVSQILNTPGSR